MGFAEQVGFKELLSPGTFFIGEALERLPGRAPRVARQVTSGLGYSGAAVIRHPRRAGKQGVETVTGIPETVTALNKMRKDVGYKKTGLAFLVALREDYKKRYGENWEEEMDKHPLSNLFDALSGPGWGHSRGCARRSCNPPGRGHQRWPHRRRPVAPGAHLEGVLSSRPVRVG